MTYTSLSYSDQLIPFNLIWSVTSYVFPDSSNHHETPLLFTEVNVGHPIEYPLVTLECDVFAFRGGYYTVCVGVGQDDVPN